MKRLILLLLILFSSVVFSQYNNIVASQMSSKFIEADEFVGDDGYGFEYFVKNNVLFKINEKEIFQYKNLALGKISRVDLQNPLRILIFYENFNTVIALDNQLNDIQKINFTENENALNISAAGTAALNNYWVFNQNTLRLGLYNFSQNDYKSIGVTFRSIFKKYFTTYNYFYWIDSDNNLWNCDLFGKVKNICQLPEFESISLSDETNLVYQNSNKLYLFDLQKKISTPINIVQKTFKSFYYKNQNLAIFTDQGITNYKINLP